MCPDCFFLSYNHQPYCWQVALQQSLLPLRVDVGILSIIIKKATNYLCPHCPKIKNQYVSVLTLMAAPRKGLAGNSDICVNFIFHKAARSLGNGLCIITTLTVQFFGRPMFDNSIGNT